MPPSSALISFFIIIHPLSPKFILLKYYLPRKFILPYLVVISQFILSECAPNAIFYKICQFKTRYTTFACLAIFHLSTIQITRFWSKCVSKFINIAKCTLQICICQNYFVILHPYSAHVGECPLGWGESDILKKASYALVLAFQNLASSNFCPKQCSTRCP